MKLRKKSRYLNPPTRKERNRQLLQSSSN